MIEPISVKNLKLGYGNKVVLDNLNFTIPREKITVIMGGSGGGKSTILKSLIGLLPPLGGEVFYSKESLYAMESESRDERLRHIGVLYQGGALWSSRTVAENVAFPLEEFTNLDELEIRRLVDYKLALVGMEGSQNLYPEELSGGMRKRVALARAMALDPSVLFLDEPSAGLDPLNSRRLDELIIQLSEGLKTTFVVITHELASIHAIAQNCLYVEAGRIAAEGTLAELKSNPAHKNARLFLEGYTSTHA